MRKLTNKEQFDVITCLYFLPINRLPGRINPSDKVKYADLSSSGIQPEDKTPGFINLTWGKTYRDLQITEWMRDIQEGLITKGEIYASLPKRLRPWAEKKLGNVPYDVNGDTTRFFTTIHRNAGNKV